MARVDNTGGSGFTVDNGTGLVVRTKLNQVIGALSTLNQGSGEMSIGVAAYVPHIDGNTLKIRNAANNAFVSLGDVSLANFGHASLSSANTFTARATFSVTSSITLPSGTTAQRDGSPAVGMIRHNSETNSFEGYNNGAWGSLSGASGISNVVDDTSPQLGGNLDLQAFELNTSTSNGNLKLNPNGTGVVEVKGDGSSTNGKVQLNCSQNSHGVKLESPDHSASQSYTIKLPDNQIAANKFLKVKSISGSGSTAIGQLEFADGSGGVTSDAQQNTVAGTNAGANFSGTSAERNSLFGYQAGVSVTTGDDNSAFGRSSLEATTTGSQNTAVGVAALNASQTASSNTAVGYHSLLSNTTGASNVAVGALALDANTTGDANTAIGQQALGSNTTASDNVAVGRSALLSNTTGTANTGIGRKSLEQSTTASNNTALGYFALAANTTGASNTAVGSGALDANTTASSITAVGANCLGANTTGGTNTGVGSAALLLNTTGHNNSAMGGGAMFYNTTGYYNSAFGANALYHNTTGYSNTAIGYQCLYDNTTGLNNTAVGHGCLDDNTTANNNTGVGYLALATNTTGAQNTGLGAYALNANSTASNCTGVGYASLYSNTSGSDNTSLGYYTLFSNTTGYSNTALGHNALTANTTGAGNVCVGKNAGQAVTTGSNLVLLGMDSGTSGSPGGLLQSSVDYIILGNNSHTYLAAKISLSVTSDQRDKSDIKDFTPGLSWINKLRPVTYYWDQRSDYSDDLSVVPNGTHKKTKLNIGLIAQEELEVEKEHGFGNNRDDMLITDLSEDGNSFSMKYERLVPILVNAIKELSAKVTALEAG